METRWIPEDESNRRQFLTQFVGRTLGVSLLPVLWHGGRRTSFAAEAHTSNPAVVPGGGTAKRVIYLFMNGGMSHLDTFDLKPGRAEQGPIKPLATSADGIRISHYLPQTARHIHEVAVVNSVTSTQGAHAQGVYYMYTSNLLRGTVRHPAMGGWAAKCLGAANPNLPSNIVLGSESRHPGGGYWGARYNPLILSPEGGLQNSKLPAQVTAADFEQRLGLLSKLDRDFQKKYPREDLKAYHDAYAAAVRLMSQEDAEAFDLNSEPESVQRQYGDSAFGKGCLLARRLAERDVRFVQVSLGGWDTHSQNFPETELQCRTLDAAFATLLGELSERGLLAETLVVLATEFGRSPQINVNQGRDHHPQAFTCLLAGGGVRGGQAHGRTNEIGGAVDADEVTVKDFNATIAYAMGLPWQQEFISPDKRPFKIADDGQPVRSLFE
jgi:hypothetical protein